MPPGELDVKGPKSVTNLEGCLQTGNPKGCRAVVDGGCSPRPHRPLLPYAGLADLWRPSGQ
jgi:hypothetical protein